MAISQQMKISIVTPSFNQAGFLEEALLSVKNQGYTAIEHIIMDGGSTDGSVEILKRFSSQPGWKHLHWVSEPDGGQGDALNKGFKLATGGIIGWLNSDDRYRPGCFEKIVGSAARSPEADVLYGDSTFINENSQVWRVRREIEFNRFILRYLYMLYILSAATFFRRRIFQDENWINIKYSHAMDYEFFLRLDARGYKFEHVPELLADFRFHPESKTVTHPEIARMEHDSIVEMYSPVLKQMPGEFSRKALLTTFRVLARGLRYSEKLLRGYYFEQFAPSSARTVGAETRR